MNRDKLMKILKRAYPEYQITHHAVADEILDSWISVEDELPDAELVVWAVWYYPVTGNPFVAEAWINQDGRWTNDEAVIQSMGYIVTHWMLKPPLPAPPQEE